MAKGNLGINVKVNLESEKAVNARLKQLADRVGKNNPIKLQVDTAQVNKALSNIEKQSKKIELNSLDSTAKQSAQSVQHVSNNMKNLSSETKEFGTNLSRVFQKFSIWYLMAGVVTDLFGELRDGVQTVADIDRAVTTMNVTMDMSTSTVNDTKDAIVDFALEMKTSAQNVYDAMQIYANMNETLDEMKEKSEATIVLSNLTGNDISQSADALQGLQNQFKLTSDDAMYMADVLTKLGAETNLEFSRAVNSMSDAVARGGSSASEAGLSMEQYLSTVVTLTEQTRLAGSTVSTGLRTMFARISRVTELEGEELSKIEGAFKNVGLNIRDTNGEFKDMWTILTETSNKWDELTDAERSYIAEQSAGVRRKDMFISMMNNFGLVTERATDAVNAQGFAMERQEIYADSLAGHLATLKGTINELWTDVFSADELKDFTDIGVSLVKSFGTVLKAVDALASAFGGLDGAIPAILSITMARSIIPMLSKGLLNITASLREQDKVLKSIDLTKHMSEEQLTEYNKTNVAIEKLNAELDEMYAQQLTLNDAYARRNQLEKEINMIKAEGNGAFGNQLKELQLIDNEIAGYEMLEAQIKDVQAQKNKLVLTNKLSENQVKNQLNLEKTAKMATTGAFAMMSAFQGLNYVLEDGISAGERASRTFDSLGNTLLMIPNPWFMLGGAVSKVIGAIIENTTEAEKVVTESLDNMASNLKSTADSISDVRSIASEYSRLAQNAMNVGVENLGTDEYNELMEVMQQFADVMPSIVTGYDAMGNALIPLNMNSERAIELLQEQIKAEQELYDMRKAERQEELTNSKNDMESRIQELQATIDENQALIERYEDEKRRGEESGDRVNEVLHYQAVAEFQEVIGGASQEMLQLKADLAGVNIELESLNGWADDASTGISKLALTAEDVAVGFKSAKDSFAEATDGINDLIALSDSVGTDGMTAENLSKVIDLYPDLINQMNDEEAIKARLAKEIQKQIDLQETYYKQLLERSTDYYQTVLEEGNTYLETLADQYGVDLKNAQSLADAKYQIEVTLKNKLASLWSEYYNASTGKYTDEYYDLYSYDRDKAEMIAEDVETALQGIQDALSIVDQTTFEKAVDKIDFTELYKIGDDGSYKSPLQSIRELVDLFAETNAQLSELSEKQKELARVRSVMPDTDSRMVDVLKQENALYKEQQKLIHSQANTYRFVMEDARRVIESNGIDFLGDDVDFEAYSTKIVELNKQIYSASGDAQSRLKDQLSSLQTAFKDYVNAQTKSIPALKNEWRELYQSITENELAINRLNVTAFDKKLEELSNAMDMLGEDDTIGNLEAKTALFNETQTELAKKLRTVAQLMGTYQAELESLDETTEAGAIKAGMLRSELEALNETKVEIQLEIKENYTEDRERMYSAIQELEEQLLDVVKKRLEEQADLEDKAYDDRIEKLDAEKEKWEELYDARIKALEDEQASEDHQESINDLIKEQQELQDELNKLSMDDSREASAKRKEVEESLAKVQKELADETRDYQFDQAVEAIESEKEAKLESIDEQVTAEEERHEAELDRLAELNTQQALYAEAHKIMMSQEYGEISTMITDYQDEWGEGFSALGDNIKEGMLANLREALDIMEQLDYGYDGGTLQVGQSIDDLVAQTATDALQTVLKLPELASMSDSDYIDYANNKLAYELTNDQTTKEILASLNEAIRDKYDDITADSFSYLDLANYGQSSKVSSGALSSLAVESLLTVNGNVDRDTLPELQTLVEQALAKLQTQLNLNGIYRPL